MSTTCALPQPIPGTTVGAPRTIPRAARHVFPALRPGAGPRSTPAAPTTGPMPAPGTLARQLELAAEMLVASGWTTSERLQLLRRQASERPAPEGAAGIEHLCAFLLEHRVIGPPHRDEVEAMMRLRHALPAFVPLRTLGAGGMGIVFLARQVRTGELCALKTLHRTAGDGRELERFAREVQLLQGVSHPHIAALLAHGETAGIQYLAMEYVEGPTLLTLIDRCRTVPERAALRLIRQVAEGLAHAAARDLIHRDVKPENILIQGRSDDPACLEDACAKLIDFGLAKSCHPSDQRLTTTGMTVGTPWYMAPEQVCGEPLDCRCDIYGLGAVLYHALTGVTPFTGSSAGAIMSAHLTEPVPDPISRVATLHPLTRQLVRTALAKEPAQRYLHWSAFIAACDQAIAALTPETVPQLLRRPMPATMLRQRTPLPFVMPAPPAPTPPSIAATVIAADAAPLPALSAHSAAAVASEVGHLRPAGADALRWHHGAVLPLATLAGALLAVVAYLLHRF